MGKSSIVFHVTTWEQWKGKYQLAPTLSAQRDVPLFDKYFDIHFLTLRYFQEVKKMLIIELVDV